MLRISTEVVKEVQRIKKKLGQPDQNCSSCSLVNCSRARVIRPVDVAVQVVEVEVSTL
jgi:hypothetical protein